MSIVRVQVDRRLRSLEPLVVDDGCDVRLRGGGHADGVRVALLEWLPLARRELAAYECGLDHDAPAVALAALVRPPTIWTAAEALQAARLVSRDSGSRRMPPDALVSHAFGQLEDAHLRRLRSVASRFALQLPVEGLSRASATVAAGCTAVAHDDETCAAVAASQLVRYAASAFVARRLREAAPTMT